MMRRLYRISRVLFLLTVLAGCRDEPTAIVPPQEYRPAKWAADDVDADALFASSNLVTGSPRMTGTYPSNVIWLFFKQGATEAQKEAAASLVSGRAIVSYPMGPGGMYYVLLEDSASTEPDLTGNTLFAAIDVLNGLPQVDRAMPDLSLTTKTNYLRPADGNGWGKNDWSLDPTHRNGPNWGLEVIRAPLAWGCETGDSTLQIGVVDYGFHARSDLTNNIIPNPKFGNAPVDSVHGTQVASILAAHGNNQQGITGVMWRARLRLSDWKLDPFPTNYTGSKLFNSYFAITELAQAGATIINASFGYSWYADKGGPPSNTKGDSTVARNIGYAMTQAIQGAINPDGKLALVVIAAGNDRLDAWWSGVAQAAADPTVQDQVIVVAASDASNNLQTGPSPQGSNHNIVTTLVGVAAPGENVGTLDGRATGTSFAAPHVAGLAGLLKSFDPRLTADSLKHFILMGADSSGLSAGGIPIIDAYKSLQFAARRKGAPLCGNRLWIDNGRVMAQRGTGASSFVEELFQVPFPHTDLQALHGSTIRIMNEDTWDEHFFSYNGGAWAEQSIQYGTPLFDSLHAEYGPSYRSYYGEDHNGESWVYTDPTATAIQVYRRDLDTRTDTPVISIPWTARSANTRHECIRMYEVTTATPNYTECMDSTWVGQVTNRSVSSVAVSPLGGTILIAIATQVHEQALASDWLLCRNRVNEYPVYCRNYTDRATSSGGELYSIPASGGTYSQVPVGPVHNMYEVLVADGRPEFSTKVVSHSYQRTLVWPPPPEGGNYYEWRMVVDSTTDTTTESCQVQFRSIATGALIQTVGICGYVNHTFSPSITPSRPGQDGISPLRPSRTQPPQSQHRTRSVLPQVK